MKQILIVLSLLFIATVLSDYVVVETKLGKLRGQTISSTMVFKGIRYAQAPVRSKRWRPPEPLHKWTGIQDAVFYGPSCIQFDPKNEQKFPPVASSEDCLFLNIWAPTIGAKNLPVLVWNYGGKDLNWGHANGDVFDGLHLAKKHNIVVVTLNHRLGIFGFMGSKTISFSVNGEETIGNYGMMDQQIAMKWIKENINAFGGDPNSVTLMGVGGGAKTFFAQNMMKGSKLLYKSTILQESLWEPVLSIDTAHNKSMSLAEKLGCPVKDYIATASCLRTITTDDLLSMLYHEKSLWDWDIIADGVLFPLPSTTLALSKKDNPMLIGFSTAQGVGDVEYYRQSRKLNELEWSDVLEISKDLYGENGTEVASLYTVNKYSNAQEAAISLVSDFNFLKWSQTLESLSGITSHLYLYIFDHKKTVQNQTILPTEYYSQQLLFGTHNLPTDNDFSIAFQDKIVNFIKRGTFGNVDAAYKNGRSYTKIDDAFVIQKDYKNLQVSIVNTIELKTNTTKETVKEDEIEVQGEDTVTDLPQNTTETHQVTHVVKSDRKSSKHPVGTQESHSTGEELKSGHMDIGLILGLLGGIVALVGAVVFGTYYVYTKYFRQTRVEYVGERVPSQAPEETEEDDEGSVDELDYAIRL